MAAQDAESEIDKDLVTVGVSTLIVLTLFLIACLMMEPQREAPHPATLGAPQGHSVGGGRLR